jgi:phage terminase large subunit GpA-like protein
MSSVRAFLVETLKRAYRPIAKLALEVWAEANIWLDSKESLDNPGPYKRIHAVYAARILDAFLSDPQWRTLLVMKSSQSGFTLHVLIAMVRRIAEMATSIIYVIDSLAKAKDLSKTRLQPLLKNCVATKVEAEGKEDGKMNTLVYEVRQAVVRLAGSGSAGQVASFPADFVVGDELDKWPVPAGEAHPWLLLIQRIKRSEHGKAIGFSTPTDETGITFQQHQTGSQHRYFVPCPHCGHMQVLDLESMRFAHCKVDGGLYDFDRVLRETYAECTSCKGRIEEDHKPAMMLAGEVRATNFREAEVDGVKTLMPAWTPGEMSFHISDFYSLHPKSTWGHIIVEFLRAQGHPGKLHDWTNGRAGLPVKKTVANVGLAHILRLRENYKRGALPVVPCVVTMQVDNQGDHQKWTMLGMMRNGTAWVIDYGKTLDRKEILEIAKRKIPVGPDNKLVSVQAGIMDEGGKDGTTYEVRKFCAPLIPFFFPAKGRGGIQVRNTVFFADSKLSKGGLETIPVCHFDDDAFKRELYIDRIRKFDRSKVEEFDLPRLCLPMDIEEEFCRELCGEELVRELDANGNPSFVWKSKPPNDWGDCLKMGMVLWNVIGHKFQPGGK